MNDQSLHELLSEIDVSYNGRLELWDYLQVNRTNRNQKFEQMNRTNEKETEELYSNDADSMNRHNFSRYLSKK